MVILLQGTFTPLVHAHAGRTKTLNYTPAASGLRRTAKSVLRTGCRLAQRYCGGQFLDGL
ncbi:hypothetical protein FIU95_12085 [Microbulbifer sp. THAF38]|nr:hypothetical protein FIU95_12085 [Microbulbifer sp. THAF38]